MKEEEENKYAAAETQWDYIMVSRGRGRRAD